MADGFLTATLPLWSPNGHSLLFFGRQSADASPSALFDWWWTSPDGGAPVATGAYRLLAERGLLGSLADKTTNPPLDALPVQWSTRGVLFSARYGESVNLWRLGVSEADGQLSAVSLERLTTGAGSDLLPSTATADRIVLQVATETAVSLILPLEPNTAKVQGAIARHLYDAGDRQNRNSLDHAGRQLAYVKVRQRESEIWVKDLMTGQERHVLTTSSAFGFDLNISPDGTKIAYVLPENGVNIGYLVPTSGGTATKVCERCGLQGWFPDNRRILALDRTPEGRGTRVTVVDTVDGTRRDLVINPGPHLDRARASRQPAARKRLGDGAHQTCGLGRTPVRLVARRPVAISASGS